MFSVWSVLLLSQDGVTEVVVHFKRAVSFTEAAVLVSGLYGSQVIGLRCQTVLWWPEVTQHVEVDNSVIQL
jgi:hypothetical protein